MFKRIAIMVAMQGEAAPIIHKLNLQKMNPNDFGFHPKLKLNLYSGIKNQVEIFLIQPGHHEAYAADFIGTQAAALTAFTVIEKLNPDTIISAGTAGGLKNSIIGDVFISKNKIVYHDRRITFENYGAYGKGSYDCLPLEVPASLELKLGIVSSGSSLDPSAEDIALLKQYDADVVDMEAAAIAEVATRFDVKMIAVKAVTNLIDNNLHQDFVKNYHFAVTKLAEKLFLLLSFLLEKNTPCHTLS